MRNSRTHHKTLDRTVLQFIQQRHQAAHFRVQLEIVQIKLGPRNLGLVKLRVYDRDGSLVEYRIGIPDVNTFVNLGLNSRPTFFGCNASNFSNPASPGPLLVYLPNSPFSAFSNVSTFALSFTNEQRNDIIQNGYNVATQAIALSEMPHPARGAGDDDANMFVSCPPFLVVPISA